MGYTAFVAPVTAGLALALAYGLFSWMNKSGAGTYKMKEVAGRIRTGAMMFLKREYIAMAVTIAVLSAAIWVSLNLLTAALYIAGAFFSALSCFFGMRAAIKGNVRAANAAEVSGVNKALKVAFRSGAVMGLCVTGLGLLGVGTVFAVFGALTAAEIVCGFGLGASSAALLACAGGGIYTKAAVLGSDIFESYTLAMISAIILAVNIPGAVPRFGGGFDLNPVVGSLFPLLISSIGLMTSMLTIMFVRGRDNTNPASSLNTAAFVGKAIVIICSFFLSRSLFGGYNCAVAATAGIITGMALGKVTEVYTSESHRRAKMIADQQSTDPASAVVSRFRTGMASTVGFILCIALCILAADSFAGLYGISIAAVGMLSTTGMSLASGAFGHISGSAGGIAEAAQLSERARQITGILDAAGKTAAAKGRAFARGSTVLTSIALFVVYSQVAGLRTVNLLDPLVIAGLAIGAMLPFGFGAMGMKSNGKTSIKGMLTLGLIAIIVPFAVGILAGVKTLGGMLAGAITAGVLVATMLDNAGALASDMTGGLFKDNAGPFINILIKFIAIVAIVFSGIFIKTGGIL